MQHRPVYYIPKPHEGADSQSKSNTLSMSDINGRLYVCTYTNTTRDRITTKKFFNNAFDRRLGKKKKIIYYYICKLYVHEANRVHYNHLQMPSTFGGNTCHLTDPKAKTVLLFNLEM